LKKIFGFLAVLSVAGLLSSGGMTQPAFADDTTAKIDYTVKVGKQKHLVHLTVCAGSQDVSNLNVIVHSWQDEKEISLKKVFPANTCKSFEVILEAKHANRIGVLVA